MAGADGSAGELAAVSHADGVSPAAAMFGDALSRAEQFADLLSGAGVERGIIGPAEAERIWERHLLNCGAVAPLIPSRASVIDLGSGGGLPGIVLALLLPRARLTLLEPLARRAEFLTECADVLGLENVDVVRGRAEEMSKELSGDVVTARAVAPLERLSALSLGLARPGGIVLAIKGASAEAELARALPAMRRLGISDAEVLRLGGGDDGASATVVRFTAPAQRKVRTATARQDGRGGRGRQNPSLSGTAGPARAMRGRPNSRRSGG